MFEKDKSIGIKRLINSFKHAIHGFLRKDFA